MTYQAHYINPLRQFGKISYDLILSDPDGILPSVRQNMQFPKDVLDIDLIEAAENFTDQVLSEQT